MSLHSFSLSTLSTVMHTAATVQLLDFACADWAFQHCSHRKLLSFYSVQMSVRCRVRHMLQPKTSCTLIV